MTGWDDPAREESEPGFSPKELDEHNRRMTTASKEEARRLGINLEREEKLANSSIVGKLCDYCPRDPRPAVYKIDFAGSTNTRKKIVRWVCAGCSVNAPRNYAPTFDVATARKLEAWFFYWDGLDELIRENGERHMKRRRTDFANADDAYRLSPDAKKNRGNPWRRAAAPDFRRGTEWLIAEYVQEMQWRDAERKREQREYENVKKAERERRLVEEARQRLENVLASMTVRRLRPAEGRWELVSEPMFASLGDALRCRDSRRAPLQQELGRMYAEGFPRKVLLRATGYSGKQLTLALEKACSSDHAPDGQDPGHTPTPAGADSSPAPAALSKVNETLKDALNQSIRRGTIDERTEAA